MNELQNDAQSVQTALFRKMPPSEKIRIAEKLYWNAFFLKMKWLEQRHPDWSAERVAAETKKLFLYART